MTSLHEAPSPAAGGLSCQAALQAILLRHRPGSVLVIGARHAEQLKSAVERCVGHIANCVGTEQAAAAASELGRYDLAVIVDLEATARPTLAHLIARLRDINARRLLLLAEVGTVAGEYAKGWSRADLVGLGLEWLSACRYDGRTVDLYHFDIDTYKTTPDWLNSRYWANPDLFDKYRW